AWRAGLAGCGRRVAARALGYVKVYDRPTLMFYVESFRSAFDILVVCVIEYLTKRDTNIPPNTDEFAEEFGAANLVSQFQRVISWILQSVFGVIARSFLDDVAIKGPRTKYNSELIRLGIRRYVLEHLQNLDKTLYLLELASAAVLAEKS
ncbi:hypothetical protein PENANT_c064G08763, partial [Penicillium antarcticum]